MCVRVVLESGGRYWLKCYVMQVFFLYIGMLGYCKWPAKVELLSISGNWIILVFLFHL